MSTWWIVLVGVALTLASACGSDRGSEGGAVSATVVPSPSAGPPTPIPNPTVEGDRVRSNSGYEASIPAGWRLSPNIVGGRLHGDAYFEGAGDSDPSNPPASLAIVCDPVQQDAPQPLDAIVAEKLKSLETLRRETITTAPHGAVAGQPAAQIDYIFRLSAVLETPTADTPNIVQSRREIVFTTTRCIWTITLATPEGQLASYERVLETFLATVVIP